MQAIRIWASTACIDLICRSIWPKMNEENVVNVNIGVLGHVDSGKTSFCAAISTVLSTAALDKSPQSQERGITQDLQFSAFRVEKSANGGDAKLEKNDEIVPENPAQQPAPTGKTVFNFTLVDCPGHASLIRTIIGGTSQGIQVRKLARKLN